MSAIALDFINRHCKNNRHEICHGRWSGFGFEVFCKCPCHDSLTQSKVIITSDKFSAQTYLECHSAKLGKVDAIHG
jgi:hypothetical protein